MLKVLRKFEGEILKYATACLILAIPLYPKFPFIQVPGSWVAIRLEDFLIAAIFAFWLFVIFPKRREFLKSTLNRLILIYFAIGFLSFLAALLVTKTIVPYIGFLHALRRVEYMVVFFIAASSVRSKKDLVFFAQVFLITGFLVFVYGLGQKYFGLPVISTMNVEFAKGFALRYAPGARVSATFAGHYDLGAWLVLLIPLVITIFFAVDKFWKKFLVLVIFFSCFWLLLASASRISFAAYLGAITITLIFLKRKLWIVPVLAISILASSFSAPLTSRYSEVFQVSVGRFLAERNITFDLSSLLAFKRKVPEPTPTPTPTPTPIPLPGRPMPPPKPKRYLVTPTPTPTPGGKKYVYYGGGEEGPTEDRSMSIRFKVEWPRALRALAKNPFLGTGFSSVTLATDNDYLRALGEVGLLGFITLMMILLLIIKESLRVIFNDKKDFSWFIGVGITCGILGFFANAFFIDVFEASKAAITFWLLSGILIGISRLKFLPKIRK